MPKLAEMSDEDLRRVIDSDVQHMQQADLSNEQRKLVERRYAICISEAIGRTRLRMRFASRLVRWRISLSMEPVSEGSASYQNSAFCLRSADSKAHQRRLTAGAPPGPAARQKCLIEHEREPNGIGARTGSGAHIRAGSVRGSVHSGEVDRDASG